MHIEIGLELRSNISSFAGETCTAPVEIEARRTREHVEQQPLLLELGTKRPKTCTSVHSRIVSGSKMLRVMHEMKKIDQAQMAVAESRH